MRRIRKRNKKALSVMIGYILLITFGIIMSAIVYSYLKTYVPKEFVKCPDGVSLFIEEVNCSDSLYPDYSGAKDINITIQNNGKFNVAGYFIHATNNSSYEIATIDLSQNVTENSNKIPSIVGNAVIFDPTTTDTNSFQPTDEITHYFKNITYSGLAQIEIIPIRYEMKASTQRLASCGDAKVWETVTCS